VEQQQTEVPPPTLGNVALERHVIFGTMNENEVVSCIHVFEWFNRFRMVSEDLENDPWKRPPLTARNPETVTKFVNSKYKTTA